MRWTGHLARMVERYIQCFSGENWGKETAWKTYAYMGW